MLCTYMNNGVITGSKQRKAKDRDECHAKGGEEIASQPGFGKKLRDLPVSVKLLFCNPTYVLLIICDGLEAFMISGFIHFSPKLLQNIFNLSPGAGSMIAGK